MKKIFVATLCFQRADCIIEGWNTLKGYRMEVEEKENIFKLIKKRTQKEIYRIEYVESGANLFVIEGR